MEGAEWEDHHFALAPGERLLFVSDGATECTDAAGEQLSEEGVAALIGKNRNVKSTAFLDALLWDLSTFSGDKAFDDDVSALLFEYRGPDEPMA